MFRGVSGTSTPELAVIFWTVCMLFARAECKEKVDLSMFEGDKDLRQ